MLMKKKLFYLAFFFKNKIGCFNDFFSIVIIFYSYLLGILRYSINFKDKIELFIKWKTNKRFSMKLKNHIKTCEGKLKFNLTQCNWMFKSIQY